MNIELLKEIIERRKSLESNDDFACMECWKQEAEILSKDVSETISFLKSCSDEEFYWISEVFDDIIGLTQSKELLLALHDRAEKIESAEYKESIEVDLKYADYALDEQ